MDNLTKPGATELARRIVDYWRAHGFPHVEARVVPLGRFQNGHRSYGVRSNLCGGLPPRARPNPDLMMAA